MQVYKFGGASIKDAKAVKAMAEIVIATDKPLFVVVSAMDKMTNIFETLAEAIFDSHNYEESLNEIYTFHDTLFQNLVGKSINTSEVFTKAFNQLNQTIKVVGLSNYHALYDQIVPFGELLSSILISEYFTHLKLSHQWLNASKIIQTNSEYRKAKVSFQKSKENLKEALSKKPIYISQGFIGGNDKGEKTTLGREGSDYSAAIFANLLDAELITIWKDVPGVLSADPKKFKDPTLYSEINYHEAIEMAYFGASVIHPKTIQPLQEKNIPLFVRPFENPKEIGTKISNKAVEIDLQPNIIHKNNQVLISLSAKDYEFVAESHISDIFNTLAEWNWQVNLMQNGAVSFSICCDMQERNFEHLISELTVNYKVRYNKNLELFTIRHYKNSVLTELNSREILLEQKSRNTIQYLVKSTNS